MPLPKSAVIPTGWNEAHRPVATSTMTATCTISRNAGGDGTYNPVTGQTTWSTAEVAVDVPCRVQAEYRDEIATAGDRQATVHRYLVTIPHDTDEVLVDDVITVTAAADTQLVGKTLRVRDVIFGSLQWERDLRCEMDQG